MSQVIVNADDLGYTPGIHKAVEQLFAAHALSSATAMATGSAVAAAAEQLSARGIGIGGHVVLVDGYPVSPPETIPSLAPDGRFRPSLAVFARDLLLGRIATREIEAEAAAQLRSLQFLGLRLTHVDTHKHTHLFAGVLRPLLRAASACGIGAIRNPFEPAWARRATPGASLLRRAEVAALGTGRAAFLETVRAAGLRTPAGALGVLATGTLDERSLEALFAALQRHGRPEETWELVCHPGIHDAALNSMPTRLRAEREQELRALKDIVPRWTTGKDSAHILTSFANL